MSETEIVKPQQYAVFSEPIQITEDVAAVMRVSGVLAKEGVYTFPAGPNGEDRRCLWSRPELLKATRTARAAKITILDHPPAKVVTNQDEIYGIIEKPFYDRDRIKGTFAYDADITPKEFLEKVRKANAKESAPLDVSIGFYYSEDATPGDWHGQPYDLVMRNIVIDHVATGVWRGRCPAPSAGIGVASTPKTVFMSSSQVQNIKEDKIQMSEENKPNPEEKKEKDEHGCLIGKEKWNGEKCVPLEEPKNEAPVESAAVAAPVKLDTASLITTNAELLALRQCRRENNRIEAMRRNRHNPMI
jgi:hypothetical protein